MALRVGSLSANTATVSIEVGDETLNVVYKPSGLTPETEDALYELADAQRGGATLIAFLQDMLVSWDLLGEDDKPLPVNEATLRSLPVLFLSQIVEAISNDMRPNLPSGEDSDAGSLRAVK